MIRDATAADIPAIAALYVREVLTGTATFELEPPSESEMSARLEAVRAKALPWIVAEIDGAFAGYAYLSPFRTRGAYRYIVENSVYVEETARGRGVGRALLSALTDRARTMGLRHVVGVISDGATCQASIALHRTLGFADAGTWRQSGWKFDRWIDVHVLQLDLDPGGAPPTTPGLDLG